MGEVRWCVHHFINAAGIHMCKLQINILALLPYKKHGMRFTMPCNTDNALGFEKVTCARIELRPTYEDIIRQRAQVERERRLRRNERKAERALEQERDSGSGFEGETGCSME